MDKTDLLCYISLFIYATSLVVEAMPFMPVEKQTLLLAEWACV